MSNDIYSGSINWDEIYRRFHDIQDISEKVRHCFEGVPKSKLLFSGFSQVAAELSSFFDVQFVEFSEPIARLARQKFSALSTTHFGDVLDYLPNSNADAVAIVCRISAYWTSSEDFRRLIAGLQRHHRKMILIDFFDRDSIEGLDEIHFDSGRGHGVWTILGVDESCSSTPQIHRTKLRVCYSFDDSVVDYVGDRSFFRRTDCLRYFSDAFPSSQVECLPPLIAKDHSFTIRITSDESLKA